MKECKTVVGHSAMIPAIKKLYKTKEERAAALKRHLEFFNTHPYVASPIIGVTLALEEERANGAPSRWCNYSRC